MASAPRPTSSTRTTTSSSSSSSSSKSSSSSSSSSKSSSSSSSYSASSAAKTIADYKADYAAAQARGDAAGMKAANDGANAIRVANGEAPQYATNAIAATAAAAKSSGSSGGTSSGSSRGTSSGVTTSATLAAMRTGRIYQVGKDGTAPSGLTVGDQVVTGGGTYMITGVKADGTYNSVLYNPNQTTRNTPSTAYTSWGSTGGGATSLEARLAGQSAGAASTYVPQDNSAYLQQLAAAYLKQQQAALESAYKTNLSGLDSELSRLTTQYDNARTAESANEALARQRWQETAAAYGLNSGTAGQAELSFANQRQSGLSSIQQAEAAARQEVERQRTLLGQQYQSALNQALASNNADLYEKLYAEATRVDQALQQQQQFDASQALKQYQTLLDQYNADRSFEYNTAMNSLQQQYQQTQAQSEKELASAKLLASGGDYSAYGKYYGWSDDEVNRLNAVWAAQQAAKTKSSGGYSGGGNTVPQSVDDPYQKLFDAGIRDEGTAYASFIASGLKDEVAKNMTGYYIDMLDKGAFANQDMSISESRLQQIYNNIVEAKRTQNKWNDPEFAAKMIINYSNSSNLGLTRGEAEQLLRMFGYNPADYLN